MIAAAKALGAAGSLRSVERLLKVAADGGAAGREAAGAIARIQDRLPGAGKGLLSLASDDAQVGALSPGWMRR